MTRFALSLFLVGAASADPDPQTVGPGLEISLIAETTAVVPGQPLTLGLHLEHHEGFHTYWKNPGNVGVATATHWTLPEDFSASPLQWPAPENTFMGPYPCHGYERDVTLLTTISVPRQIEASEVTFTTQTVWMCCAKGCFPGNQTLSLTLPVAEAATLDPAHAPKFAQARAELPTEEHKITAELLSAPDAPKLKIRFRGPDLKVSDDLYFFSSDSQISSEHRQLFLKNADGSLTLGIKRNPFGPQKKNTAPGVLKINSHYFGVTAKPANSGATSEE